MVSCVTQHASKGPNGLRAARIIFGELTRGAQPRSQIRLFQQVNRFVRRTLELDLADQPVSLIEDDRPRPGIGRQGSARGPALQFHLVNRRA